MTMISVFPQLVRAKSGKLTLKYSQTDSAFEEKTFFRNAVDEMPSKVHEQSDSSTALRLCVHANKENRSICRERTHTKTQPRSGDCATSSSRSLSYISASLNKLKYICKIVLVANRCPTGKACRRPGVAKRTRDRNRAAMQENQGVSGVHVIVESYALFIGRGIA